VTQWLTVQDRDFIKQGIQDNIQHYNKCLNCGGNCMEKQWDSGSIESALVLLWAENNSKHMQCKLEFLTASQTSVSAYPYILSELCFCAITILGDSLQPYLFTPKGEKAIYRSLTFFPTLLHNMICAQFGRLQRV
jgi:hypothetical protein